MAEATGHKGRHLRHRIIKLTLALSLACITSTLLAQQEEPRLNTQFQGEKLGQVLQMLSRGYGLEYTMGEGVDPELPITVSLVGVTVDQALTSILSAHQLMAVEQDGRFTIKQKLEPKEREVQIRDIAPSYASTTRRPPSPSHSTAAYEPRRGVASDSEDQEEEERDEIMEVMWPLHLGADMASAIFGGGFVEAGGYYGGGGYGGGSGGYGGSYSSGSYGSSYGSRGGTSGNNSLGYGTPTTVTGSAAYQYADPGEFGTTGSAGDTSAFRGVLR